ncbi:hypothetical protein SK128_018540, partial [Halocaridina rubra]
SVCLARRRNPWNSSLLLVLLRVTMGLLRVTLVIFALCAISSAYRPIPRPRPPTQDCDNWHCPDIEAPVCTNVGTFKNQCLLDFDWACLVHIQAVIFLHRGPCRNH